MESARAELSAIIKFIEEQDFGGKKIVKGITCCHRNIIFKAIQIVHFQYFLQIWNIQTNNGKVHYEALVKT